MIKQLLAALFCLLALTACGSKNSASRTNDLTPLTSMQVVVAPSIANGTSTPVTVIGNFSGQFSRDITSEVTITSSAPLVANFAITALPTRLKSASAGTTTITAASSRWGINSTATVTVKDLTLNSIDIQPVTPSIPKGLTAQLSATGNFSDGSSQDITIDATWSSDTLTVATVGDIIPGKGLVTAIDNGTGSLAANITASFGVPIITKSTTVTVTSPVPTSIAVTPANPTLLSLTTTQFTATATYSDNTTNNITNLVTWSSSTPSFAAVDNGTTAPGKAFALSSGTTQISATIGGVTGSTSLKVIGGGLSNVVITPITGTALSIVKGSTLRLSATGTFSNGTSRDITANLTWASADTNRVQLTRPVLSPSLLYLDGIATTTTPVAVTASFGATTISNTAVTVTAPTMNTLSISPPPADMTTGVSTRLSVLGTFSDGTSQDLTNAATWTSSNPAVVSVGNNSSDNTKGKITANQASTTPVTITATFNGPLNSLFVSATINSVTTRDLLSISVANLPATLTAGNQVKPTVTANYSGKLEDVTELSSITFSPVGIAQMVDSVSLPGAIIGMNTGTTTATVTLSPAAAVTQSITVQ